MEPVKIIWTKDDTFDTMRNKLLELVDKAVVSKDGRSKFYTIFSVGKIEADFLTGLGPGFTKFLKGDDKYAFRDGTYNFDGESKVNTWSFTTEYGVEDSIGNRMTIRYKLFIPRETDVYKDDLMVNNICVDENHPFIFDK